MDQRTPHPSPTPGRARLARAPWIAVALAALLPYGSALRCGFAFDDAPLLLHNPHTSVTASWFAPLIEPYWPPEHGAGLYRPITLWTFRWQRAMSGDAPLPFHAGNVLLHMLATLLVLAVLRRVLAGRGGVAFAAALLFAVHPLHTEAVTAIVGRAELLAAVFGLSGYLVWLQSGRRTAIAGALLFALAAGSKESALGWLLLLAAHRLGLAADGRSYRALKRADRPGLRRALTHDAAALLGCAAYGIARIAVLGDVLALRTVSAIDNPLFAAPLGVRVLGAFEILGRGIARILIPMRLCADHSFDTLPVPAGPLGIAGLTAVLLLALLGAAIAYRRRRPLYAWGLIFYGALILPVSNLIVPIGTIMAERLLYLPMLGIVVALLAAVIAGLGRLNLRRAAPYLLAGVLLFLGTSTWIRNRVWQNDLTLWRATVAAAPRNVKARVNLGSELARAAQPDSAAVHYARALSIAPQYLAALNGLAHVRILQQRFPEAEDLLGQALRHHPRSVEAWVRLGNLHLEQDRAAPALAAFEQALAIRPQLVAGLAGRASALFLLERYPESADAWAQAQAQAGHEQDFRRHLAAAGWKAGRLAEAEKLLRALAREQPGDPDLLADLATLLLERGERGAEALGFARAAAGAAPDLRNLTTLLRVLVARGDCGEAEAVLSSAAVLALDEGQQQSLRAMARDGCRTLAPGDRGR